MRARRRITPWAAIGGLVALWIAGMWLVGRFAPGELVRPVDPNLFAAAVFIGVLTGLLLVARLDAVRARTASPKPGHRLDTLAGALILPVLVATACLRLGVQAVAFAGMEPQPGTPTEFTITGTRAGRGGHFLRVRLGEAGREFSVPVRTSVYSIAEDGDRVTIPIETGRFGIQRALFSSGLTTADVHRAH